jgi:hypothetical protein
MRKTLGTVFLTLACTALVFVLIHRFFLFDYFEKRYPAELYFARFQAIDEQTSKPIDIEIEWDYERISPFLKGSGPSRIAIHDDKTVTVAVVGLGIKEGLPLKISAAGYIPKSIKIWSDGGGVVSGDSQVTELFLRRSLSSIPEKKPSN